MSIWTRTRAVSQMWKGLQADCSGSISWLAKFAFLSSGDRTEVFKEDGKWPDSSDKFAIFRITGKSKWKCCYSRVAGRGSKIQDFMMILLAMFDSSVLDVGAKFTSRQVSDEVSRVLKKSGITGVARLLLILTIFSSTKWTNLLARSTTEELVGKSLCAFLWRRQVIVRKRDLLSLSAE